MNNEEAIEILKRELNSYNYTKDLDIKNNNYFGQFEEKITTIDTILDYIADLEKENAVKESNFKIVSKYNEELENKLKIQTQNYHSAHEDINWFCDKYIPKQKVRDKIEEIQNRNYNDYTREQDGNEVKYSILNEFKELLEEGD